MDIEFRVLAVALERIISKLKSEYGDSVDINFNYYLSVSSDIRYDVKNIDNPNVIVESLDDDWTNIISSNNRDEHVSVIHLDRVAGLLLALSEKISSEL